MNISVIIPLKDEADSLPELTTWIRKVMETNAYTYEVILVDDGSNDQTTSIIKTFLDNYPNKIEFIEDNLGNLNVFESYKLLLSHADADYYLFCDQDEASVDRLS